MHIRVHTKNALDSSSDRRRHEATITLEISFFLWLKSLFVGLDLCVTSLMFPKEEPDDEQIKSDNASMKDSWDVSVSESNVGNKKHCRRKSKTEKQNPLSDIDLYGIQWDDETVVYPDGRKVSCHVSSRSNDAKVIDESHVSQLEQKAVEAKSDNATSLVDEFKTGEDLMANDETEQRRESEESREERNEIDFTNPPHSNRWKARNLPPRKPFIPKY